MKKHYSVLCTLVILAILLTPPTNVVPAQAQTATTITISNTQSISGTVSAAPFQFTIPNYNVGTGANRLLVVGISANNAYATSVTFGTAQLTRAVTSFQNNEAEFYYLTNPSGSGNIVITMNGATSAVIGAYAFSGVNQTSPIAGTVINFNPLASPSSPTVSITTKYANDLVADLPAIYGGVTLGSPTCTQQWTGNVPSAITGASSTILASSPGTVTCSWTASRGDQWDDVALEVRASGAAPPPTVPSAPTGLTATGGNTTASLSWTAPSSNGGSAITGYNIYRSTTSGTEVKVASASASSTSYTDTGLTNGQQYFYKVTAVNAVGESVPSNEASATPATVPGSPTGLTATPGSSSQINLSWTAPASNGGSPITGYNIYRSTTSGTEIKTASIPASSTTYSDTTVTTGQQYFYEVTAVNSAGESAKSNEASATLQSPSAPTALTATGGNATVSLSWTAPSNSGSSAITGYNIYRGTAAGGESSSPIATGVPSTSYLDKGLTNGVAYYYVIKAVNSAGTSPASNEASATPATTPSAPTGLAATGGNTQVTLSWTAPSNNGGSAITGYNIYRSTTSGTEIKIASASAISTSYTDTGLTNGQQYFYEVTAVNSIGESAKSNEANATPQPISTAPSAPTALAATGGNTTASLSWTAPSSNGGSAITGYNIYRSTTSGTEVKVASATASSTSYTDTGLTNGQQYFYEVTAVNAVGESAKSNEASATPATAPSAPTGLTATTASSSQINLSWTAPASNGGSAITGYKIERSPDNTNWSTIASNTGSTSTSYSDMTLSAGTTYYYRVSAINSAGTSHPSNVASATTQSASGGSGPVTISNTQSTSGTVSAAPFQFTIPNYNVGTGANRLLVVGISANNAYANSITFGTASLTRAVTSFQNNEAEFYYLTNPSGSGNIVITMNGATSAVIGAYAFSGVNQTSPIAGTAINFNPLASPSSPTVSITTKYANDLVADLPAIYGGVTLGSPTCTQGWYADVPSAITGASSTITMSSPGTVTCSWTASRGDQWDDVALEVRASGTTTTVPSAPTGLAATGGNTTASLSWTAPSSNGGSAITGYNIYRSTTSGTEVKTASISASSTSYTDTGLTNGQKYYYEVTAVNAIGESAKSTETSVTPVTTPSAPTALAATGGNTQVSLSWTVPSSNGGSPITNYKIYRSTTTGTEAFIATAGNVTSYTDTGLTNGQQYFYKVTAVNAVGESAKSNEANATPQPGTTAPSAPTGLTAAGGNTQVTLSWTAPTSNGGSAITGYNIYRSTTSGTEVKVASASASSTTYTDIGLTNGQQYFYKVTAVNAVGESVLSNEASATPSSTTVYSINKSSPGLAVSDSLTNETRTQQQLASNTGYWIFGGSAPSGNYTMWRDPQGLHIGLKSPVNGSYYSWYAESKSVNANLFHGVLTAPVRSFVGNNVFYNNGLYVTSSAPNDPNYVTCASSTSSFGTVWGLFFVNRTSYNRLWFDPAANQALTRDCAIVTNGTNYLKLYMDGVQVYESKSLNLGMPSPFINFFEVASSYHGQMLNSTYTDYYATSNENVTVSSLPSSAARVDLANSAGSVITSSPVAGSKAILAVGNQHFPLAGTIKIYDSSNALITSASESIYGGDAYSVSSGSASAPSAPTGLTAAGGNTQVTLSWTAPSSNGGSAITGYNIYRGTTSGTEVKVASSSASSTSYTDTGLTNGQQYFYEVTAVNSVGESAKSTEANATPQAPTPGPVVTSNIQTTSGTVALSPFQFTIPNYNVGTGANRLLVVGISANNFAATSVTFGTAQLTRAVTSFHNNEAEFYYLTNPNGTGNIVVTMNGATSAVIGAYAFSGVNQTNPIAGTATNVSTVAGSPTISITTKYQNDLVADLPAIYGGISLSSPTCTLSWNNSVAAGVTGASSTSIASSPSTVTCSWTSSGLGDLWDDAAIEVRAAISTSGGQPTVPSSPTSLTATAISSSQISLSWNAPTNNGGSPVTGYKIERSTDNTNWSAINQNTASTATSYSDNTVSSSTTYYYRVSAINSVGTGAPSNTATVTTPSPPACSGTGPTICTSASTVNVGTDVKVTGVNFAPNSQITFSYDGAAIGVGYQDVVTGSTSPLTVTTDSGGNFVGIMQTLRSVTGTHTISVQDASKDTASKTVTVSPHVFFFPTTAKPGTFVLIPASQGNGFAANSPITISFDSTNVTPKTPATDSKGNFGGNFTVPSTATSGTHTVTISDGSGDKYSTSFTVDPNAHSFSSTVLATGLAPACSFWKFCTDVPAYFAFIPDKGSGVDGSGAFMTTEKNSGNVVVFTNQNGNFVRQSVNFVTVPNLQVNFETNGLMGIAFDPNWANTVSPEKWVYLYLTTNQTVNGKPNNNVIGEVVRYHATTDASGNIVADQTTGQQVVLGNIPDFYNGHNGGGLKFDSQGNLYISTGDGWQFDVVSQSLTSYQGKILRIAPVYGSQVSGNWYTIPSSNPFASSTNPVTQSIWSLGHRNPYAWDLDQKTGKIYVSSTGFNTWETILNATAGGSDDGWSEYERPAAGNPNNLPGYVPALYWYGHQGMEPQTGISSGLEALSAGAFYHGTTYPGMDGAYFFGDYGIGKIQALLPTSTAPPVTDPISGVQESQVTDVLYNVSLGPIYMEEWNGKIYYMDLFGQFNVLNYN